MSKNRFVSPVVVRLPLSEDDWVEVKERLSFGEAQALNAAGLTRASTGPANGHAPTADDFGLEIDMARWAVERVYAWLVDWSFRDAEGRPVKLSRDAVRALDSETAQEIQDALDRHVAAQEEAKKASGGRPTTGAPSP